MKKVTKRLFAIGTGALMLGATAMGALAAVDLKDYPAQFVKSGTFNGYLVVGENAKPIDNLAMTDIAASMKYLKAGESAATTVEGDAWLVGTSAKKFEMANNNASTLGGEGFYDIATYISEDELEALSSGTYSTGAKDYTYNQYLYFDSDDNQNAIVGYVEDDDEVTADFLYFKNSAEIARYKMEFTSPVESDIASDLAGTASTSGQYLSDLDGTKINMLGKEYTVVLATRPTSGREDSVKLVLMGGASSDTLLEGEEKTYTLAGTEYKVKLTYVDDDEAKFVVNGQLVDKMQVGQTKKLSDGKEIGVSEILYQSYAGGVHSASFFLGASKIELRDDIITDTASGYDLTVGSESIDGAHVVITGTDDNTTSRINTLEVNVTAEDDYFVAANGKLSDVIAVTGNEKEALFTNNWDIEYKGLTTEATHDIDLGTSSDRRYTLSFYDGDNNKATIPLAYAVAQYNLSMGEENADKMLVLDERIEIEKNDYFVVTGGDTAGNKKSYALQYKGSDDSDKASPKIKFKNLGDGDTLEYGVDTATAGGSNATRATIKLGGYSFIVQNSDNTSVADDWKILVALNGDSDVTDTTNVLFEDYYGAQFTFAKGDNDGNSSFQDLYNLTIQTPNSDDYDNHAPMALYLQFSADSSTEVSATLSDVATTTTNNLRTPEGMSEISFGYTAMGTKVTWKTPSSSPELFNYAYPEEQILPQVYVTSGAVTSSTSADGTWTPVTIVDATKLDSEVADAKAQNLIVIGGPCVNSVAAALLGNPANCADGFTPGKAKIKLFENGANVAMLVAGYTGEDTRLAGKVVANRWKELTGSEVEVEGTTYTDAKVGAPVVTPAVVETPVVE